MRANQIPPKFAMPFGANAGPALIRAIPVASQIGIVAGAASLADGFPPLTGTALASGGVPPAMQDFNGIMQLMSAWDQWTAAAGLAPYDPAFSTLIGGYPQGATVLSAVTAGRVWISTLDNNVVNPDSAGQTAWLALMLASDVLALIAANAPQIVPGNPTLYVDSSTGSDTTGTGTASAPYKTITAALNYGVSRFALGGKTLLIQLVSAGTYAAPPSIPASVGAIVIQGNASNPNGYTLSGPGSSGAVIGVSGVSVTFRGVLVYNTSSTGNGIAVQTGGAVTLDACWHGAANNNIAGSLVVAFSGGSASIVNASNIQTDCSSVLNGAGGTINVSNATFTVTKAGSTITVTTGFATASQCGTVSAVSTSFTGFGATGPKYSVSGNGIVNANGGGVNYWPGNVAGTTVTGGQYLP